MFQENVTVFMEVLSGMIKTSKIKESEIQVSPYLNILSTLD